MKNKKTAIALALTLSFDVALAQEAYQPWAIQIGADLAHSAASYTVGTTAYAPASQTGAGVTIAVMDSSVSLHNEFKDRVLPGWSYPGYGTGGVNSGSIVTHGTHVAGIAASGRGNGGIIGVAPDAWILPVQVLSDPGSGSSLSLLEGARWAVANYVNKDPAAPAKTVFNMSLGGSTAFGLDTLQTIKNSGSISVVAAGNEGRREPSYPARFASDASVAGWTIVVGAVNATNTLASFSNRAGSTANYYMVAPGVGINSTVGTSGYESWNGTSMATPMVSGAAALVWGAWPYLKGNQVVNALLWSASDLGTAGVDSVYGWGLLQVDKAMQPIGSTCVPTVANNTCYTSGGSSGGGGGGSTKPGKGGKTASVMLPSGSGMAVLSSQATVVGYDSIGRHFYFSVAELLKPGAVSVAGSMGTWMANSQPVTQTSGTGMTGFALQGDPVSGVNGFSYTQAADLNGYIMAFKGNGMVPFGLAHSNFAANAFVGADALKIPYLGFMQAPTGMAYGQQLANGLSWRVGYLAGGSAANRYTIDPLSSQLATAYGGASVGEISARRGALEIIATLGTVQESGAFLGTISPGVNSTGKTSFSSLSSIYSLGQGLSALATFSHGLSRGAAGDGVADFRTTTQSYSAGLLKQGFVNEKDRLAFSMTMPSRVTSGAANLQAAVDVNMETGAPIYGVIPVSLAPQGRERRFELAWNSPLKSGSVALTAMRRLEPNHDANAPAENVFGARFTRIW